MRGATSVSNGELLQQDGLDPSAPRQMDLDEPLALVRLLARLQVRLLNVTAGSPYYVPHLQRPAVFPPSDGYSPPEEFQAAVMACPPMRSMDYLKALLKNGPKELFTSPA